MAIDNCSGAWYKGLLRVLWATSLSILSLLQLEKKITKNGFQSENALERIILKNCNFVPFCYLIKSVLLRREHIVNRGCNLEIPYLLTILLSIPLNKLSWIRTQTSLRPPSPLPAGLIVKVVTVKTMWYPNSRCRGRRQLAQESDVGKTCLMEAT